MKRTNFIRFDFFLSGRVPPNNARNGNWFLNDKVVGRRRAKEMGIVELCGLPRCFRKKFAEIRQ